jgi:hypothetical protein
MQAAGIIGEKKVKQWGNRGKEKKFNFTLFLVRRY